MGHVQKRGQGAAARYQGRYTGPDGREHTKLFDRQGAAKDWVTAHEAEIQRGDWLHPANAQVTLRAWSEEWYSGRTGIAPTTLEQYRTVLDVDILPGLGDYKLRSITSSHVRRWVAELTTTRSWQDQPRPLAESTATTRLMILASIFKDAQQSGLITRTPTLGVRPPKRAVDVEPIDPEALPTADELWALHDAASPVLAEAIIVAAGSGLRQGELVGLRLRNARVLKRELDVVEQLQTPSRGSPVFRPPKTTRARRRIPVGDEVCLALARHLEQYPAADDEPVFRSGHGGLWRRNAFGAAWGRAKAEAGARPGLRWHELRHFYASTLIAGGASVREVMDRMGHASAEETISRYSRLWPDRDETTRSIADAALRRNPDGTAATP